MSIYDQRRNSAGNSLLALAEREVEARVAKSGQSLLSQVDEDSLDHAPAARRSADALPARSRHADGATSVGQLLSGKQQENGGVSPARPVALGDLLLSAKRNASAGNTSKSARLLRRFGRVPKLSLRASSLKLPALALAGALAGGAVGYLLSPGALYRSMSEVVLSRVEVRSAAGGTVMSGADVPASTLEETVAAVTGEPVLIGAVAGLPAPVKADFARQFGVKDDAELAGRLASRLSAAPGSIAPAIRITALAPNAVASAELANAVALAIVATRSSARPGEVGAEVAQYASPDHAAIRSFPFMQVAAGALTGMLLALLVGFLWTRRWTRRTAAPLPKQASTPPIKAQPIVRKPATLSALSSLLAQPVVRRPSQQAEKSPAEEPRKPQVRTAEAMQHPSYPPAGSPLPQQAAPLPPMVAPVQAPMPQANYYPAYPQAYVPPQAFAPQMPPHPYAPAPAAYPVWGHAQHSPFHPPMQPQPLIVPVIVQVPVWSPPPAAAAPLGAPAQPAVELRETRSADRRSSGDEPMEAVEEARRRLREFAAALGEFAETRVSRRAG